MYYTRGGMGQFNAAEWLRAVQGLPQTQRDINELATASKQARSPEVQQIAQEIKGEVQTFANVQLALQALSTLAILGIFILNVKGRKGL